MKPQVFQYPLKFNLEQRLLAHIAQGEYREIDSFYGHDGFLLEADKLVAIIGDFLEQGQILESFDNATRSPLKVEWSRTA